MKEVVMVSACRTAIGSFLGSLKSVQAKDLAITASREAISRAGIDAALIDEITLGQVYPICRVPLPARQVGLAVGLLDSSSAVNINQNCASSMRALEIAAQNIQLGKTDIALV